MKTVLASGLLATALMSTPVVALGQCMARHWYTGFPVAVFETSGLTPGNAYAVANWAPNGMPMITYGPRFGALPPLLKDFVKLHECAHLSIPTMNEIEANCAALRVMRQRGLSVQDEARIAQWTHAEGQIGFQYGGSGGNFWQMTLRCAGPR